ncbi:DUF4276 family protein [Cupriavidus sp. HPC(L)]|uniref:DUF4276 family protein n=1 Tax=Cupriavidus sp. HPC(L) TaxID=1217418 RepID=UPI000291AD94|nr:DUF4276 family protein [Cupriavidus sp. HPC(L)]
MSRKIGIIVEGAGEIDAISSLIGKVDSVHEIKGTPLRADLQPKATPMVIARSARSQVLTWCRRGVDSILILIDREDHPCAVQFSQELRTAFNKLYSDTKIDFQVVVKDKSIENWLIADPVALKTMTARFKVSAAFEKAIQNKCCDSITNPIDLLNSISIKKRYHKGDDPASICKQQNPLRAAANSRSYRKLLRELGSKQYATQSKYPHTSPRAKTFGQKILKEKVLNAA